MYSKAMPQGFINRSDVLIGDTTKYNSYNQFSYGGNIMAKNEVVFKEHSLTLKNREEMSLMGVCEVISFSDTAVLLRTDRGELCIRGEKLNIGRLNTETGELYICGIVSLMRYGKNKRKGGFLEGLMR